MIGSRMKVFSSSVKEANGIHEKLPSSVWLLQRMQVVFEAHPLAQTAALALLDLQVCLGF